MKILKIFYLLPLLLLTSCDEDFFEQIVEVDVPEHTPTLAVSCYLNAADTVINVFVTSTVGILVNEDPPEVTDAEVRLLKDGNLLYEIPYFGNSVYQLNNITPLGDENAVYTLEVSAPNFESITAKQRMPQSVPISNAEFEAEGTITEDGDRVNKVTIEWTDPGGVENYYIFGMEAEIQFDPSDEPFRNYEPLGSTDPLAEDSGNYIYMKDATFDGNNYKLIAYNYGDYEQFESVKFHVFIQTITEDRYLYEISLEAYENSKDNPFAEPAILYSNIENGSGLFSLTANSLFTIEL